MNFHARLNKFRQDIAKPFVFVLLCSRCGQIVRGYFGKQKLGTLLLNEGIPRALKRKKTSSQKFTVISLDFWRDKLFLVFQIWGQNTIGGQFLGHCHLIWNCPWFLKRFLIFQIWGYILAAKSKCKMPSDFWWKRQVFFHWYIFFFF